MATNESIMALPLASKFKAEARAMADRGLSTYEAVYQLNKLEEQVCYGQLSAEDAGAQLFEQGNSIMASKASK